MGDDDDYEDDFEDYEDEEFEADDDELTLEPAAPTRPQRVASPPQPPPQSEPPPQSAPWALITLDDLDLADVMASGAMGTVHAGVWRGMAVAVKTLKDTSAAQLQSVERELLVHAELRHPRVVALHGASLAPPTCCIVMERCECSLFQQLHSRRQELERRQLVRMAIQIAEGMAFLHSRSPPVVHRDLKSHNVLIDTTGDCKLCDFGLVNSREVTAGLPNYMAPNPNPNPNPNPDPNPYPNPNPNLNPKPKP